MNSVQNLQVLPLDEFGNEQHADGKEGEEHEGENHLNVWPRPEAKDTEQDQLGNLIRRSFQEKEIKSETYLASSKLVDFSLWNSPYVMIRGIGCLLHEHQGYSFKKLVAGYCCDGEVKK